MENPGQPLGPWQGPEQVPGRQRSVDVVGRRGQPVSEITTSIETARRKST